MQTRPIFLPMVTYSYYVDMFINFFQIYDEFWKESDAEIDEDIAIDGTDSRCMSPWRCCRYRSEIDCQVDCCYIEYYSNPFFLTAKAFKWLLKFLVVLLRYLGRYSPKLMEIAGQLLQSLYQYES